MTHGIHLLARAIPRDNTLRTTRWLHAHGGDISRTRKLSTKHIVARQSGLPWTHFFSLALQRVPHAPPRAALFRDTAGERYAADNFAVCVPFHWRAALPSTCGTLVRPSSWTVCDDV